MNEQPTPHDLFMAAALTGLLATHSNEDMYHKWKRAAGEFGKPIGEYVVSQAREYADSCMKERNKNV